MMPAKLRFPKAGVTYTFNNNKFTLTEGQGSFPNHTISTSIINGGADGEYYKISIKGIEKDELPVLKDFRLTFDTDVSKEDIEKVKSYLENPPSGQSHPTTFLSGPGCGVGTTHICLKTITTVKGGSRNLSAYLFQTIPLNKGIIISGNTAALNGTLDGFIQSESALAVGNLVGTSVNGETISNYDKDRISTINWTKIGSTLINQFNSNKSYNANEVIIYNDANWNLNSADKYIPHKLDMNTFSTPPEGRLWNVFVDSPDGFYKIGQDEKKGTTFSGAGTISVRRHATEGSMPVKFLGGVSCASGTRFALITEGDIVFEAPSNGNLKIDCGTYISLGGNIIFGNNDIKKGTVNGIFIAKGNILLPNPGLLTETFNINPDTNILKNPPVLLRELLKIVFGTSS
ncbi:MAG: hypothetical protein NUV80_00145 [Candidatus Berkelbacteria bacterium]|nr:hypothetical protein [Candidatus Berkelbacteria bacterium]